jgi:hypothetical protein
VTDADLAPAATPPSSSVAAVRGDTRMRVTPAALRASLRRRGVLDMGVVGGSLAAAMGLAVWLNRGHIGWHSLFTFGLLLLPVIVMHRLPPHRCPACKTPLEAVMYEDEQAGVPHTTTACPRCEVEVR